MPGDRRRLASLVAIVVNLGGLGLGTLIAGVIADRASSPLRLPFVVDLVLLAAAGVALALTPETIRGRKLRLRLQRLAVPKEVRTVFIQGATVGFASSAVAGLFGSVAPVFLAQELGETSHALAGGLVCLLFAFSALGQLAVSRLSDRRALIYGCVIMVAGIVLLAIGLDAESLSALVASSVVVGLGQGLGIGARWPLSTSARRSSGAGRRRRASSSRCTSGWRCLLSASGSPPRPSG